MSTWQDRVWNGPDQLEKLRRRRDRLYPWIWALIIFVAFFLSLWIAYG